MLILGQKYFKILFTTLGGKKASLFMNKETKPVQTFNEKKKQSN